MGPAALVILIGEEAMNYAQIITVVIVAALGFKFVPETGYPVVIVVALTLAYPRIARKPTGGV